MKFKCSFGTPFFFFIVKWEFASKLFSKTIFTPGPGCFFEPIAVEVRARYFGLRKVSQVGSFTNAQDINRRNA